MRFDWVIFHVTSSTYTHCISGWGNVRDGGILSSVLQKTSVPLVSVSACERNRDFNGYFKKEKMMCAGPHRGDGCGMDTGGPLVCKGKMSLII